MMFSLLLFILTFTTHASTLLSWDDMMELIVVRADDAKGEKQFAAFVEYWSSVITEYNKQSNCAADTNTQSLCMDAAHVQATKQELAAWRNLGEGTDHMRLHARNCGDALEQGKLPMPYGEECTPLTAAKELMTRMQVHVNQGVFTPPVWSPPPYLLNLTECVLAHPWFCTDAVTADIQLQQADIEREAFNTQRDLTRAVELKDEERKQQLVQYRLSTLYDEKVKQELVLPVPPLGNNTFAPVVGPGCADDVRSLLVIEHGVAAWSRPPLCAPMTPSHEGVVGPSVAFLNDSVLPEFHDAVLVQDPSIVEAQRLADVEVQRLEDEAEAQRQAKVKKEEIETVNASVHWHNLLLRNAPKMQFLAKKEETDKAKLLADEAVSPSVFDPVALVSALVGSLITGRAENFPTISAGEQTEEDPVIGPAEEAPPMNAHAWWSWSSIRHIVIFVCKVSEIICVIGGLLPTREFWQKRKFNQKQKQLNQTIDAISQLPLSDSADRTALTAQRFELKLWLHQHK